MDAKRLGLAQHKGAQFLTPVGAPLLGARCQATTGGSSGRVDGLG